MRGITWNVYFKSVGEIPNKDGISFLYSKDMIFNYRSLNNCIGGNIELM